MSDGWPARLQLRIGLFIVGSLAVFLAVIYLLGAQARYFERKIDLYTEFVEVGGLIEGATVRLAGVQIGRVTDVSLPPDPGGKVRVTMTIARRFADRVRRDSRARMVTQGLLGDRLIEITIGSASEPPVKPGEVLPGEEPSDMGRVLAESTQTLASINRLATTLRETLERMDGAGTFDDVAAAVQATRRLAERVDRLGRDGAYADLGATLRAARRITEEIETGRGWLHALVYEEPQALRRLNALLETAGETLARARAPDTALGTLLSADSGRAVRSFLAAMHAIGRAAEAPGADAGLLSTLLFDPAYRPVAEDLSVVARNLREVSERLLNGQGVLGSFVSGESAGPAADFQVAMANLRTLTERLKAGEGTLGGLLEDPSVYENLAAFLEGAGRSSLLRLLIRSTLSGGAGMPEQARGAGR